MGRTVTGWRWELVLDGLALVAVVLAISSQITDGAGLGVTLVVVAAALIASRRWTPVISAIGLVGLSAASVTATDTALTVWMLTAIGLFSLTLRRTMLLTAFIAGAQLIVLYLGGLMVLDLDPIEPLALLLPTWALSSVAPGYALRAHAESIAAVHDQARAHLATREAQAASRVEEERLSIARDLHDSIANSIAVMTINASSALGSMDAQPDRARESLHQIRRSGANVLKEMTAILSVLRRDSSSDDIGDEGILPVIENIPGLIEAVRSTGAVVDDRIDHVAPTDPATSAALFRVAQESLTNARRHGDGTIRIRLTLERTSLVLQLANELRRVEQIKPPSGFGLIGMRERVESAGGSLEILQSDTTFTITASFIVRPEHALVT